MGLFSKKECCICKNTIKGDYRCYYENRKEKHYVCLKCLRTLRAEGFDSYRNACNSNKWIKNPDELIAYSEYYNNIINNPSYDVNGKDIMEAFTLSLGRLVFNKNFITVCGYDNLVIDVNDVIAVVMERDCSNRDVHFENLVISLITKNPLVPYITTTTAGSVGFNILRGKSDTARDTVCYIVECFLPNLRYPVLSARELKKLVKKDDKFSDVYTKKELFDLLLSISSATGIFSAQKASLIVNDYVKDIKRLEEMGYYIGEDVKVELLYIAQK